MDEMTFEQAMERLEIIAEKLSEGKLPLDEMVRLYEEGEKLAKYCTGILDTYEKRLTVIEAGEAE